MTPIRIAHRLPFVTVTVYANGQQLVLENVVVDTGSAETVLKTHLLEQIGVILQLEDRIIEVTGIGGTEHVVRKQIEALEVGELKVSPVLIQLGGLKYSIPMDGILGWGFLRRTRAVIDMGRLELYQG